MASPHPSDGGSSSSSDESGDMEAKKVKGFYKQFARLQEAVKNLNVPHNIGMTPEGELLLYLDRLPNQNLSSPKPVPKRQIKWTPPPQKKRTKKVVIVSEKTPEAAAPVKVEDQVPIEKRRTYYRLIPIIDKTVNFKVEEITYEELEEQEKQNLGERGLLPKPVHAVTAEEPENAKGATAANLPSDSTAAPPVVRVITGPKITLDDLRQSTPGEEENENAGLPLLEVPSEVTHYPMESKCDAGAQSLSDVTDNDLDSEIDTSMLVASSSKTLEEVPEANAETKVELKEELITDEQRPKSSFDSGSGNDASTQTTLEVTELFKLDEPPFTSISTTAITENGFEFVAASALVEQVELKEPEPNVHPIMNVNIETETSSMSAAATDTPDTVSEAEQPYSSSDSGGGAEASPPPATVVQEASGSKPTAPDSTFTLSKRRNMANFGEVPLTRPGDLTKKAKAPATDFSKVLDSTPKNDTVQLVIPKLESTHRTDNEEGDSAKKSVDKKYVCPETKCWKVFKDSAKLEEHATSHSHEVNLNYRYSCFTCKKDFIDMDGLRAHLDEYHPSPPTRRRPYPQKKQSRTKIDINPKGRPFCSKANTPKPKPRDKNYKTGDSDNWRKGGSASKAKFPSTTAKTEATKIAPLSSLISQSVISIEDVNKDDRTVFVCNLGSSVGEKTIRQIFADVGKIEKIILANDARGKFKGYCHVRFSTIEEAKEALKKDGLQNGDDTRPAFVSMCNKATRKIDCEADPSPQNKLKYSNNLEKNKLFLKGLPTSLKVDELQDYFKPLKGFLECRLVTNKHGESKGLAYVEFTDESCAQVGITKTNGKIIGGQMISAMVSNPGVRSKFHSATAL